MAKKTLLEIVQNILNDLDSDEVNSISDTIESQQVANIVKSCYEEIISNRNWPHLKKLIQLEASNDLAKPTYLRLPDNLRELSFFKYQITANDGSIRMRDVYYKHPDEFLNLVQNRNTTNSNVEVIEDFNGTKLFIYNNVPPMYWTSFDDEYIVCDSYDKSEDDTLKKSKTQAVAYIDPVFTIADDFIPDLPTDAFSALEEEAKSTAFVILKQVANQKSEQKAMRQQRWLSRKSWRANGGVRYPNFGRSSRK